MKRLVLAAIAFGLVIPAFTVPAMADPTVSVAVTPGTMVIPTTTIYGRPNKPLVAIIIRAQSATDAAGAAHEQLRQTLVNKSEPGTMH
jgi:hypothetical protein